METFASAVHTRVESKDLGEMLSDREWQVVRLAAEGNTDKEIAHHLGISPGTVHTYWNRLRAKLRVSTRAEAIALLLKLEQEKAVLAREGRISDLIEEIERRQRAEAELSVREENFRRIAENLPDVIVRWSPALRITYANPAVEEYTGVSPEDHLGRSPEQMDADPSQQETLRQNLLDVFHTGRSRRSEFTHHTLNRVRYLESRYLPEFALDGRVESVLVVIRDVTEERRFGELFFQMFDNAPFGICYADRDSLRIVQCNQVMGRLMGYEPEQLKCLTVPEISHPDDLSKETPYIVEMDKGLRTTYTMPKRYVRADGSIVKLQLTCFMSPAPSGESTWVIGMVQPTLADEPD